VIRVAFDKVYLKKIKPALLCLYGFERANDKNNKESNKEEDKEEIKNLVILRYGEFNKITKVKIREDLNVINPL
jgi:hypothetical protein